MLTTPILDLAGSVVSAGAKRGWVIATAESCTGGLVAAALTEIPGSSQVLDRGLITYSNEAKIELLGVPASLISEFGAVSPECARAMAIGALSNSRADVVVAITGIAGPGGGSDTKPVGMVCFCLASGRDVIEKEIRFGDLGRSDVRQQAVVTALELLLDYCRS